MYMITTIQNIRDERDNFYVYIRKLNERVVEWKGR